VAPLFVASRKIEAMQIIPPFRMTPFEQIEPGDLFLYMEGRHKFYALKTQASNNSPRTTLVTLGPSFMEDVTESFLLPWQTAMVPSLGKNFSVLLSTEAGAWSWNRPDRTPVWLGMAGDSLFICTNGGPSPTQYFPCFVDIKTGEIVERALPRTSVYTNKWELAVLGANHPPRTILKFPLPVEPDTGRN
jgi:hypothetical protein